MTDFKDEISLLIPAYLRGELSAADIERVEAAAANDPEIKADLEFQRGLRVTLQSENSTQMSDDLGWARLSRAMNEAEEAANDNPRLATNAANDVGTPRSKFWMGATAALALLALGQFGVMAKMQNGDQEQGKYTLVTETMGGTQAKIAPLPELRMEALNDILDAVDGQIVSGPSALGLYDIQFETKEACQAAIPEFQESIENEMTCR